MKIQIILLLFLFSTFGFAQTENKNLTGKQIIKNVIDKTGGLKKLEDIKSIEATYEIQTSDNKLSYMSSKSNNKDKYFTSTIPLSLDDKDYSSFVIFNKENAIMGVKNQIRKLEGDKNLENIRLMGFASLELGYLKLDFDFERIEDEIINDIDCYVVLVKSPNGNNIANFYNKKTGLLLMSGNAEDGQTIYQNYITQNDIKIPSTIIDVPGNSRNMVKRTLKNISFNDKINPEWFRIMNTGEHKLPEKFKEGIFRDNKLEKGTKMDRKNIVQTNTSNGKKTDLLLKWISDNDYLLVESSNNKNSKPKKFKKVTIISWDKNKYFYQYVNSDKEGGTSIIEKIK